MDKKNVVIYVAGQRFSISTSDTPEHVIGIGEKVDVMIKGIQKDNPRLNRDACAILTALNMCDDETKLRQMLEVLREQVKDYLDSNEKLRAENDALRKELEALKKGSAEQTKPLPEEKKPEAPHVTAARHTAFVGKDFRKSNRPDKNRDEQNKENTTPVTAVSATPADPDEAQADSPYHQFSIFDDFN